MFKVLLIAGLLGLLAACSSMSGPPYSASSMDGSNTAGPPRSPGEGPALNPYYGAAGF